MEGRYIFTDRPDRDRLTTDLGALKQDESSERVQLARCKQPPLDKPQTVHVKLAVGDLLPACQIDAKTTKVVAKHRAPYTASHHA